MTPTDEEETQRMIVDHIRAMDDATGVAEVWKMHRALMARLGFDRLLYVNTRFRTERSLGDLDDALILSSHPRAHHGALVEGGLIRHAPLMDWRDGPGARSWGARGAACAPGSTPARAAEAVAAEAAFGVVAGYDVVFGEISPRAGGAIALCAEPGRDQAEVDRLWQARGEEIEVACRMMHRRVSDLPFCGRRRLTPGQRAALGWTAEGKTAAEAATIMGVRPPTIEKHLRMARERLDVRTTAQAVMKATIWNLLSSPDAARAGHGQA